MGSDGAGLGMSFDFGPGPRKGGEPSRAPAPPRVDAGPSPGGPIVEVPAEALRLLVLADLRGDPPARDRPPLRVRSSTLDEAFVAFAPALHLQVPDGQRTLEVSLTFPARTDLLRPERLARRVREALGLKDEPAAAPAPRALAGGGALDSVLAAGAAARTGDDVLDSIFSMVDAGPSAQAQAQAPAPAPARAPAARSAGKPQDRQVELVLREPRLRALEAAWRGLELLLARCPREGGVEVEVLDVDPAEPEAALIQVVARRHAAADGPPPPSLILVDASFSRSAADLARLELIAETGEALQCPIVVDLGEPFLGVDLPGFAKLDHPAGQLERGLERWTSLRSKPALRWLVAATNRVLLRAGSGELLWGHPGWVVLAAAASSVARTGWPGELTHPEGVDDLPTTEAGAGPLEAPLGVDAVEALAEAGLLALTGPPGRGVARLPRAPTAYRGEGRDEGRGGGLPYQLVASRLAGALHRAGPRLLAGPPDAARARVEAYARGLVGDTGPGAGAEASLAEEDGRLVVEVELRTGRAVLGGVSLVLALGL